MAAGFPVPSSPLVFFALLFVALLEGDDEHENAVGNYRRMLFAARTKASASTGVPMVIRK